MDINAKIEELSRKIDLLQDLVLTLSTLLEVNQGNEQNLAELKTLTSAEIERIKKSSPKDCKLKNFCMEKVNKATSKVIKTFAEKGTEGALAEVRRHKEAVKKHLNSAVCPDRECMEKMVETFATLERMISVRSFSVGNVRMDEIDEERAAAILNPISNPTRIRILKVLAKGKKSYAELERLIGIKGGHLQFHLRNLIRAGYVTQEKPQGKYVLTHIGLKILKMLNEIRKVVGNEIAVERQKFKDLSRSSLPD